MGMSGTSDVVPPHGTRRRYSSKKHKCRCDLCKAANAEYSAQWREQNPEKVYAAQAAWHRRNPGVAAERTREHHAHNPNRLANQRAYRAAHLDEHLTRDRAHYAANRTRILERVRLYRAENPPSPEVRRAIKSRRRQHELIRMDAVDRMLSVGYRKAIANDPCSYCGDPGEHDEHVHPLSRGGSDHWWNLVRACAPCNHSKGQKLLSEWSGRPDLDYQTST